ncbi:SET domain protein, partial [Ostertagia ostertagi]
DISCGQEVFPVRVYSDTGNCVPPEAFTYISSCDYSMFKENRVPKRTLDLLTVKCDCDDLICGEQCACREMNDRLTFCTIMGDGRVFVNSNATFFNTLIVGCGSKCACKGQCRNSLRATSLPAPFRFEVFRRSDNLGFGLRTLSNIPQGCAVVEFCGEILRSKVLSSRGAESLDYSFCLHSSEESEIYERLASAKNTKSEVFAILNHTTYIDPTRKGNIARFISHGCLPNLVMLRYAENDLRLHHSRAILFAAQPILAGTELFFDYGNNYLNRAGFKCECRTMWCDSVATRWRSTDPTHEEIMRKSLEYFAYLKQRMKVYDLKAKQYLRSEGIVRPEYDDLDEPLIGIQSSLSRIDPACVHKRNGENEPVICYNLYCRS